MATGTEKLDYDHATGLLRWRVSSGSRKSGSVAGTTTADGYVRLKLNRKLCLAHRVAWEIHYGNPPALDLDHINGNRADNRIANLRLVQKSHNQMNRRLHKPTKSGVKGVNWNQQEQKWVSRCAANGKRKHLGYFDTIEAAAAAYQHAARESHGAFFCEGN